MPRTPIAAAGMACFNALTEHERADWLRRPNSVVPADAWEEFKRQSHVDAASAVRRALALLGAASADCRHKGPSDGDTPLHWPVAVAAAKAHLTHALRQLEGDPAVAGKEGRTQAG